MRPRAAMWLAFALAWASPAQAEWVAAWSAALQAAPQTADTPPYLRGLRVDDATLRLIARPTLDGDALRLHLSNRYGERALRIGAVTVGVARGIGGVRPGTLRTVTFDGRTGVTLAPGASVRSDPVIMNVRARQALAVSLYVPTDAPGRSWHQIAGRVNFLSTRGDHSRQASAAAFVHRHTHVVWLDEVDVRVRRGWAVVAIGDSITDGLRATLNARQRWPDALSRRLRAAGLDRIAVLNAGISGNRLLHDSACYGERLVARFSRDALARPGVRAAIVLIGINDINFAATPRLRGVDCDAPHARVSAADLIAGYRRLIAKAHARKVKLYAATLTPAALPPAREAVRQAVNAWIRTSGAFDGVADFDAAVRDPRDPSRLLPQADSGDGIHPSDAGDRMLAAAVPLRWFTHPTDPP